MCATFEVTSRRVIRGLLLRPRLQSTPFTYRFAYILGSSQQEVPLLTYEHLANSVEDVLLPAGPAPFGSVFLVVYVTDVFGAQARGAVDTDRVSPAAVNVSLPDVTVDTVINYTTAALTRLSDDGADAGSGGTRDGRHDVHHGSAKRQWSVHCLGRKPARGNGQAVSGQ